MLAGVGILLALTIALIAIYLQPIPEIDTQPTLSNAIDYSNTYATVSTLYQRKTFFANGLYWLFYDNGTNLYYTSSTDGLTWNAPNPVASTQSASAVSIWYNGSLHYAIADANAGDPVTYHQGVITGNTIQWTHNQTVMPGKTTYEYYNAYVTVDSNGIPWVSCIRYDENAGATTPFNILISRAKTASGEEWTTPETLVETDSFYPLRPCLMSLPAQRMYAIYGSQNGFRGKLWDGSKWLQTENITNRSPVHDFGYSAVSFNGEIHLTFTEKTSNNIMYYKRLTNGNWEETTLSQNQEAGSSPILSTDASKNVLYCFWIKSDTLQLRKSENGAWRKITVQNLTLTTPQAISCFYRADTGKIGVAILELINQNDMIYRLKYSVFTNP
jgi:hypothetical protein